MAQFYGLYSLRPNQAFDFAGRTASIVFDVDAATAGACQVSGRQRQAARAGVRCLHVSGATGCRTAALPLDSAFFHAELAEFMLPCENVRRATDSDQMILDFYRSTYEIGASLAGWDRASLERSTPV